MSATVAVVIPSYNHGQFLAQTLASVFRQTRPPDEVHVIDDGSTDDSVEVIERAFAEAGSIRCVLTTRANRGISNTRNDLCASVGTDFVAFLDSDDLYAPNRLERLLTHAPRRTPYFAFSGVDFLAESSAQDLTYWHDMYHQKLAQGMSFPTAGFSLLRSNIAISTSNFVISRGLFDAIGGFDDRIKICQDWDFAVQALRFVEPTFVPEPLMTYRIHSYNTSHQARKNAWEVDLVMEKAWEWIQRPTANHRAPTPHNWPRYFRIFACLNASAAGRALAARLPREALASAATTTATTEDGAAIRVLIESARSTDSFDAVPSHELMRRCGHAWTARL